ncbi:hypothetical protein [Aeribacillus alveayuensis]|jgi:hypothetical protein|uniref:Uncharacterized protein n=1 Tax=Aeribacillus alveayuensis TaxID=279215 RepID=A0ABT9VNI4_9BACI|nr:hypothetical protein [Bacillus alveayuensis]
MKGKRKGDEGMNTLTLKEIEKRALQNRKKYEHVVNKVISKIENQNLNRGRVRPKDPTEAKILARFNRQ